MKQLFSRLASCAVIVILGLVCGLPAAQASTAHLGGKPASADMWQKLAAAVNGKPTEAIDMSQINLMELFASCPEKLVAATQEFDLYHFPRMRGVPIADRAQLFAAGIDGRDHSGLYPYHRVIKGVNGRTVTVNDPHITGGDFDMIMFGSNSYQNFAKHPRVQEAVMDAVTQYGSGMSASPLIGGYTQLMVDLQREFSEFVGKEDTVATSSGFGGNLALAALITPGDGVFYDSASHKSITDMLRLVKTGLVLDGENTDGMMSAFPHNSVRGLRSKFRGMEQWKKERDIWIVVEGVYSMDGDLSPLDKIVELKIEMQQRRAELGHTGGIYLIVDDAHGIGVTGRAGRGTADHFWVTKHVDIIMATASKALAANGGLIAGPHAFMQLIRHFANVYFFSTALTPPDTAAALAAVRVLKDEPERVHELQHRVNYVVRGLRRMGIAAENHGSAIIPVFKKPGADLKQLLLAIHKEGIFVPGVPYPAVARDEERLRVLLMADHTQPELDKLLRAIGNHIDLIRTDSDLQKENGTSTTP